MDAYTQTQMAIVRQLEAERRAEATAERLARRRPRFAAAPSSPRTSGWLHRAIDLPRSVAARRAAPL